MVVGDKQRSILSSFGGTKVFMNPHILPVPKIEISPRFEWVTEEYREQHNGWLLQRFGTMDVAYMVEGNLFVSPKVMAYLERGVLPDIEVNFNGIPREGRDVTI